MSNTATTKVTKKSNLNSLIALISAAQIAGVAGDFDFDALNAYCVNEIGLLDKKAEKDELCVAVESALTADYQTRQDIAAQIEGDDVTVSKVGYRLTKLVELGAAEKTEISVPGADGKARKVVAYRLIATDVE